MATAETTSRRVTGYDGLQGKLLNDPSADMGTEVEVELDGGARIVVPRSMLQPAEHGGWLLLLSMGDVQRSFGTSSGTTVIPIVHESLSVEKRVVDAARVRIRKIVTEHTEQVAVPLTREEVSVERVTINQWLDGPVTSRTEGDTLVIPLVEEVLFVQKRLVLREEIRITKTPVQLETVPTEVVLRREDVEIDRTPLDPADDAAPRRS
jgi:uncharacterized protein (TIGR02271 family)